MGMRINTNVSGLSALRQTNNTTTALLKGYQRLASGLRINRAADDAAGLAIAERFRADVRQYNAEATNLQYGVNMAQTAEGGLDSQTQAVQRIRELSVQAANGTLTDEQRSALNEEVQQLLEEIDDTAANTEFNGQTVLDGSINDLPMGTEGGRVRVNINESTASSLNLTGVDISTQAGAADAIDRADAALNDIGQNRAALGAQQNRFERAIDQREIAAENAAASESMIRDLDFARQSIEQTGNNMLLQGGIAALAQSNILNSNAANLLAG